MPAQNLNGARYFEYRTGPRRTHRIAKSVAESRDQKRHRGVRPSQPASSCRVTSGPSGAHHCRPTNRKKRDGMPFAAHTRGRPHSGPPAALGGRLGLAKSSGRNGKKRGGISVAGKSAAGYEPTVATGPVATAIRLIVFCPIFRADLLPRGPAAKHSGRGPIVFIAQQSSSAGTRQERNSRQERDSTGTSASQQGRQRFRDQHNIRPGAAILDVLAIEFHMLLKRNLPPAMHLPVTGKTRSHG